MGRKGGLKSKSRRSLGKALFNKENKGRTGGAEKRLKKALHTMPLNLIGA